MATNPSSFHNYDEDQKANAIAFEAQITNLAKTESLNLENLISDLLNSPKQPHDELEPQLRTLPELTQRHHITTNLAHEKPPVSDILKDRPYPPILAWQKLSQGLYVEAVETALEYLKRWPGAISQPMLDHAHIAKQSREFATRFLTRYVSAEPPFTQPDQQNQIIPSIVATGQYLGKNIVIFENPQTKFRQGFFEAEGSWLPFDGICTDIDTNTVTLVENFDLGKHTQHPEQWTNTSAFLSKISETLSFDSFDSQKKINEILSKHTTLHPAAINQNDAEAFQQLYEETNPEVTKQVVENTNKQLGKPTQSLLWAATKIIKACFTLGKLGIETPLVPSPPKLNRHRSGVLSAITELNTRNIQAAFAQLTPLQRTQTPKQTEPAI
jgi:hypothetical protein